ncbi:MAG: amidohydrolase family protein [Phycisphaeraceae bacterium]|nr:MAG: amidohydrolase family protein [Phycisphaeraceae bacterium]
MLDIRSRVPVRFTVFARFVLLAVAPALAAAQGPLDPPANGPRAVPHQVHALVGATVYPRPGERIENATVVIRGGSIEAVGAGVPIPRGAREYDAKGMHVYAGFVDPWVEVEAPRPSADAPGSHWSPHVIPQRSALEGPGVDAGSARALRKNGFTAAGISPVHPGKRAGGVFRGWSAAVSLAEPPEDRSLTRPLVYRPWVYHAVALERSRGGRDSVATWDTYPSTAAGAIALLRQVLSDAAWEQAEFEAGRVKTPSALSALYRTTEEPPLAISVRDELEAFRAAKAAKEFGRPFLIVGSGREYLRSASLRGALGEGAIVVTPLEFPKPPDVSSVGRQAEVDLRTLMEWERAPENAGRLVAAGLGVALTTSRLKDAGDFWKNLRASISRGLTPDAALAGLTTQPAKVLGLSDRLGEIKPGTIANLVIADGDLFAASGKDAAIRWVWIDGRRHEIEPVPVGIAGVWSLDVVGAAPLERALIIEGEPGKPKVKVRRDGKETACITQSLDGNRLSLVFDHGPLDGRHGLWTLSGTVMPGATPGAAPVLSGTGLRPDGSSFAWSAVRTGEVPKAEPAKAAGGPDAPAGDRAAGAFRVVEVAGRAVEAGTPEAAEIEVGADGAVRVRVNGVPVEITDASVEGMTVRYALDMDRLESRGVVRIEGVVAGDAIEGTITAPDGQVRRWRGVRVTGDERGPEPPPPAEFGTPMGPYAVAPGGLSAENVIIRGATIWTMGPRGVIERGVLAASGGKITFVGDAGEFDRWQGSRAGSWREIDATGKHVTPGIIDCHSHTSLTGTNETGQAVTAEVRMADATNPGDVNWYRQLAGGVTCVNTLHGSANPIGGQNVVQKLRWGCAEVDGMIFREAPQGIKFALGENPKSGNSEGSRVRYPQSRMGVEGIIRERLTAAKEYAATRGLPGARRDLELEALAEILSGDRLLHCHSYRQDEVVMLARVAREFGFRIGTYQHILDGYKVAEHVRDASGGGSAFADWWAYKVEVQDAIPQGPPLMHRLGAVMSYNSDDNEMARRLNTEAAKAVKYGGLTEAEALAFVTINPAKQLKIDRWVGSLEAGKDADIVLWSGNPLGSMTRCEATWVDGVPVFSLEADATHRAAIARERERIIQKILRQSAKDKGAGTPGGRGGKGGDTDAEKPDPPPDEPPPTRRGVLAGRGGWAFGEDDPTAYGAWRRHLDMLERGLDPWAVRAGECGCGEVHR